jgi:hypothetical protein
MHYTDGQYNVSGQFSDDGGGVGTGTKIEEHWLNAVQNELMELLETAGITGVKGTHDQVLKALQHPLIYKTAWDDTGTVNNVEIAPSPNLSSLGASDHGIVFRVKAAYAPTGASTLQVNSITPIAIKKSDGTATSGDEWYADQIVDFIFDWNGGGGSERFLIINQAFPGYVTTWLQAAKGTQSTLDQRMDFGLTEGGPLKHSGNPGLAWFWGEFRFSGDTSQWTVVAGHNVSSVTTPGGTRLRIYFSNTTSQIGYAIAGSSWIGTSGTLTKATPYVYNVSSGPPFSWIEIEWWNLGSTLMGNPGAGNYRYCYVIGFMASTSAGSW